MWSVKREELEQNATQLKNYNSLTKLYLILEISLKNLYTAAVGIQVCGADGRRVVPIPKELAPIIPRIKFRAYN